MSRGNARPYGKPEHIASPLQIMIEGPLGGAAFNNEFGRPNLGWATSGFTSRP
jgi:phosphoribosylformylglycinamidine synthase